MINPKPRRYRNKKILNAARGEACLIMTPDCNYRPETVVACHSNKAEHGKGSGQKADDCFIAFGCASCHAYIDNKLQDYEFYEQRGRDRTLRRLLDKGILK